MRKQTAIIFSVLMLALMHTAAGAIEEKIYQEVILGQDLIQYAVLKNVDANGAVYDSYCLDCIAYLTVSYKGEIILNNKSMNEKDVGTFSYTTTPPTFQVNNTYQIKIKTISVVGDGYVFSEVFIKKPTVLNVGAAGITEDVETGLGYFETLLDETVKYIFPKDTERSEFSNIIDVVKKPLELPYAILTTFVGAVIELKNIQETAIDLFIKLSSSSTRQAGINQILTGLQNIFYSIMIYFMALLILIEMFIFNKAMGKDTAEALSSVTNDHINIFNKVFDLFNRVWTMIFSLVNMIFMWIFESIQIVKFW